MPDERPPEPEPEPAPAHPHAPREAPAPAAPALPPPADILPPDRLSLSIRLHGPEADAILLIERLARELPIVLCVDASISLPDAAWDPFPPNFLSRIERDLVREDLRLCTTAEIARTLHLSTKTINSYRTHIRKQFTGIDPALRPAWMQAWLRRYPGVTRKGARP